MNDAESKLNSLRNGLGAIAETIMIFYKNLIGAGFNPIQAIDLTKTFLTVMLTSSLSTPKEEGGND